MTKHRTKLFIIVTLMLGTTAALVPLLMWSSRAEAVERSGSDPRRFTPAVGSLTTTFQTVNNPIIVASKPVMTVTPVVTPAPAPTTGGSAMLNARHRFALGMIETANNDEEIGGAGEVSRYQIMPSVWKHYSASRSYQNPAVSLEVAQQHWSVLYATFIKQAHREPTDFDMYVLWNTRYGYYASKSFKPSHLNPVVRDRAQRFVNLVQRGES